jgi:hypothetical protein
MTKRRALLLVSLIPLALVAHILFVGDRRLDSKMTVSCDSFTGPVYRKAFAEGWRLNSDLTACDHCLGVAEVNGESGHQLCGKYPVTLIYCPTSSLVVSTREDQYRQDTITELCI